MVSIEPIPSCRCISQPPSRPPLSLSPPHPPAMFYRAAASTACCRCMSLYSRHSRSPPFRSPTKVVSIEVLGPNTTNLTPCPPGSDTVIRVESRCDVEHSSPPAQREARLWPDGRAWERTPGLGRRGRAEPHGAHQDHQAREVRYLSLTKKISLPVYLLR